MTKSKYYVKVITGYRRDQEYSINANEAHKAYYLFYNPDARAVFSDGLAILGKDIQRIVPDYNASMGYHPDHNLTGDDYNEIHAAGIMEKLQTVLTTAKEIGRVAEPDDLQTPMLELYRGKYHGLAAPRSNHRLAGAQHISQVMSK